MLYRILTEDPRKYGKDTSSIVDRFYEGYTVLCGFGHWRKTAEACQVVEISTDDTEYEEDRIKTLARIIKEDLDQEAVLVQKIPCENSLIL